MQQPGQSSWDSKFIYYLLLSALYYYCILVYIYIYYLFFVFRSPMVNDADKSVSMLLFTAPNSAVFAHKLEKPKGMAWQM